MIIFSNQMRTHDLYIKGKRIIKIQFWYSRRPYWDCWRTNSFIYLFKEQIIFFTSLCEFLSWKENTNVQWNATRLSWCSKYFDTDCLWYVCISWLTITNRLQISSDYEKAADVGRCFSVTSGVGCRRESLHVGWHTAFPSDNVVPTPSLGSVKS